MYTVDDEAQEIWDGERLETTRNDGVAVEHLHRYAIAMDLIGGKSVLDLASGEGYGSNLMATVAKEVIGVDISKDAVSHASQKYQKDNLKFLLGSAESIPLESNSVDIVVSFETIEHHDKHDEMLNEIKRVLKSEGHLIISSPDKLNYTDIPQQKNPYHVKELYLDEFRALISKYFANIRMFRQKMIYASIIVAEDNPDEFTEFSGTFESIEASKLIKNPLYGVCVASDGAINSIESSIFEGKEVLDRLFSLREKKATSTAKQSIQYKIGRAIIFPAALIKKALKLS